MFDLERGVGEKWGDEREVLEWVFSLVIVGSQ